jgi:GntP family gluconate:H+ symporter
VLIAMASIVGVCLLHSGGADRIVRSTLGSLRRKTRPARLRHQRTRPRGAGVFRHGVPPAHPAGPRDGGAHGRNYLLYVLAIAVGTTMTHSLVPPTPGPLFAANALKVDLGTMMHRRPPAERLHRDRRPAYALWANRRWPTPLRDPCPATPPPPTRRRRAPDGAAPALARAAPIVLPVILISGSHDRRHRDAAGRGPVINTLGHPNIALAIAAAIALLMVATRPGSGSPAKNTVQASLADAGMIILITAAGGVFGGVLQETGVGERIQGLAARVPARRAAARVSRHRADPHRAGFGHGRDGDERRHPRRVRIAGDARLPSGLPRADDRLRLEARAVDERQRLLGLSRTAGLSERETLRTMSVMFSIMGVLGFLIVLLAATLFPLV